VIAKIDSVEIPNVTAQVIAREIIGDEARTAGGKLRRDIVAVKRTWRLEAKYLTKAQYDAIMNQLDTVSWGAVAFWLDEFGAEANTVTAYVEVERDERVQFSDSGTWESQGRRLTLLIKEQ